MTATVTDLFCGAGGLVARRACTPAPDLVMAANHWQTAIDVHQAHFPDAAPRLRRHLPGRPAPLPAHRHPDRLAGVHEPQPGPRRVPPQRSRTQPVGRARPGRRAVAGDDVGRRAVRRADALRGVVVENVVEATKWVLWPAWCQAMTSLGYRAHGAVAQLDAPRRAAVPRPDLRRVVPGRARPDLDWSWPPGARAASGPSTVRQAWKNGRRVGRYRQQWVWPCTDCRAVCEPATAPAATIIDWELDCPRIGDRDRPLAARDPGPDPRRAATLRVGADHHLGRRQRLRAHPRQPGPPDRRAAAGAADHRDDRAWPRRPGS